jgi:hypothetical protein
MDEFEKEIRDSLRRAADAPSLAPLDPEAITAGHRARRDGQAFAGGIRWLAAAAAVVVLAGVGWLWLRPTGGPVPAVPAAPAGPATPPATSAPAIPAVDIVVIDIYSGGENPELPLDEAVARELYLMVADQEAAGQLAPVAEPTFGLGFRGFVLTPADPSLPGLRILPDEVFVSAPDGYRRLADRESNFYNRVWDALRPELTDDLIVALPDTSPAIPTVTATIPPQRGDAAVWQLADPGEVDATSTRLTLSVTRLGCADGRTGTLLAPVASLGTDDIVIRVDAELLAEGMYTCPDNDAVSVKLTLPEPVGHRALVDAACLVGEAVRTSHCRDGAVRRAP